MQLLTGVRNCVIFIAAAGALSSCSLFKSNKHEKSAVTGWNYNDKTQGSFFVAKPKDIKTAPGLVFVQGGTFMMGANQEDVMGDWNNYQRRVTVNSFFIDRTEVANVHYREYLYWLENVFSDPQYAKLLEDAKPDTLVWRSELAYNEPYVELYFRHPAYNYYPVVGVTWRQATDFCIWRTDRVNELELKNKGYINPNNIKTEMNGGGQENFNTKSYLMGEYQVQPGKTATSSSNPLRDAQGRPRTMVKFEDGILFGDYRLPTEAEWEYAAYGYILQNPQRKPSAKKRGEEVIANKQLYAWQNDGFDNLRATKQGAWQGAFLANFKRGAGDNMGIAGGLNDNAAIPAPVTSYAPNGFGLYNMSVPETSSGDVTEDGISLSGNVGKVGVDAFAAKNDDETDSLLQAGLNYAGTRSGGYLPGVSTAGATALLNQGGVLTPDGNYIDQSAGLRLTLGSPDTYTAGVSGLLARVDNTPDGSTLLDPNTGNVYNNLFVYGADYNGLLPYFAKTGITFDGDFAVSATGAGAEFSNVDSTKGNEAIKAELGYTFGPLSLKGGYENVYADFAAPGYWGHIGSWTNPTNIEGGIVNIGYTITPTIKLVADGNFFKGKYNVGAASPLSNGDKLDSFDVGLKSALSSAYSLDLGYEYVYWDLSNNDGVLNRSGKPTQQYITIGIGHPINKNSDVKLLYQIIDYKEDGTDFSSGTDTNVGDQIGGVAETQLAVHF